MKIKELIIRYLNIILGYFPTKLPRGMAEFDRWVQTIIDTYNPPMDARSVRFTLSALLMRTGPTEAYKPNRYFALSLHRGAAAQVGAYVMEEIKEEQRKEYAAQQEAAATQLEATQKEAPSEPIQDIEV